MNPLKIRSFLLAMMLCALCWGLRAAGILRIARLARGGIVLFIAAWGCGLLCSLLAAEDGSISDHSAVGLGHLPGVVGADRVTKTNTLSASRSYPNLSEADISLIPKTIEDKGKTGQLVDFVDPQLVKVAVGVLLHRYGVIAGALARIGSICGQGGNAP